MNLIAIEASTDMLSLAVSQDGVMYGVDMPGGAHASAHLLPSLQRLMAEVQMSWGQLDAVVWGRGPGSFTGLRTACAVAQGIGFGHDIPLLGIDSLAACAQEASQQMTHPGRWVVALDARMGEVYVARYDDGQWRDNSAGAFELLGPQAVLLQDGDLLCGNAARAYPSLEAATNRKIHALPTAKAMLQLAPRFVETGQVIPAEKALPLYVRNKVALTTAEREQSRQTN